MYNPATGMCLASDRGMESVVLDICQKGKDQEWDFI